MIWIIKMFVTWHVLYTDRIWRIELFWQSSVALRRLGRLEDGLGSSMTFLDYSWNFINFLFCFARLVCLVYAKVFFSSIETHAQHISYASSWAMRHSAIYLRDTKVKLVKIIWQRRRRSRYKCRINCNTQKMCSFIKKFYFLFVFCFVLLI